MYLVSFPDHSPKRSAAFAEVQNILKEALAELQGLTLLTKEGTLKTDAADMLQSEANAAAHDAPVAGLHRSTRRA